LHGYHYRASHDEKDITVPLDAHEITYTYDICQKDV